VKRGRVLEDAWGSVKAAYALGDRRGVLKWEGRMEELLEHLTENADCVLAFHAFLGALMIDDGSAYGSVFHSRQVLSIRLLKRRVELLGKMKLFRDQGEGMCMCGTFLVSNGQKQESERYFQKARDVGVEHGFFLVESKACIGLGKAAALEGRHEEGLELLRNSVVAARLGEGDAHGSELYALDILIRALFKTSAIGEVELLVLRFGYLSNRRSESQSTGDFLLRKLESPLFNARLLEVMCIHPPVPGTP